MEQATPPKALKVKVLTMMFLRAVLALVFLGTTTWFQVREYSFSQINLYPLYAIVVAISIFTILYASALRWVRNLRLFVYVQVGLDIALISYIIYVTGAIESYLQVLYLLSIIGSAIMLGRKGGYYAASLSSICYGVIIDADFYGLLPAGQKVFATSFTHTWEEALTTVSTNILAYFTVALLTGYLAERTARFERELEEKGIDYEKLEGLNKLIVENITSGIMTLDDESRITSFNRAAEAITGYSLRDVYYRKVEEIFPGILSDTHALTRAGLRLEERVKKKGGGEVFLGFMMSRGQGGDAANIAIFQDLSQLKSMEEQLRRAEKLKALGELSVGIAHEIRNPLASISGSIQLLNDQMNLEEEDRSLMEIVMRETERLNSLITDFLVFAKPARQERQMVNLGDVISETLKIFKNSPQAEGIDIESYLSSEIFIEGDARQIGQVFWNILLNSAEAMDHSGRLTVTASFRTGYEGLRSKTDVSSKFDGDKDREYSFVGVKIKDTGEGIEPDRLATIFDPFFSTKSNGTGLGLAIAHRIVESHGGAIEVKSRVGKGTVFNVILPAASAVVH